MIRGRRERIVFADFIRKLTVLELAAEAASSEADSEAEEP